jgi:hypothetical protein
MLDRSVVRSMPLELLVRMPAFSLSLTRPSGVAPFGAHALIDHLLAALSVQGVPIDRDEALVLTGAAFRTYQFDPDDNWGWRNDHPDATWRWQALEVDSYGIVEAISAHYSADIRRWHAGEKPIEWLRVTANELAAGRPALGVVRDTPASLWLIDAVHRGETTHAVSIGAAGERLLLDAHALSEPQPAEAPTLEALYTVRPSPTPTPETRLPALWRDVLLFATRHAGSKKELSFEEELYYASGLRAWDVTPARLAEGGTEIGPLWRAWRDTLADGRAAAARVLARWPDVRGVGTPSRATATALATAAEAYAAVSGLAATLPDDPAHVTTATIAQARTADANAVAALTRALTEE